MTEKLDNLNIWNMFDKLMGFAIILILSMGRLKIISDHPMKIFKWYSRFKNLSVVQNLSWNYSPHFLPPLGGSPRISTGVEVSPKSPWHRECTEEITIISISQAYHGIRTWYVSSNKLKKIDIISLKKSPIIAKIFSD